MHVITQDVILFLIEIWTGISTKTELRILRSALGLACKLYASTNKNVAERAIITIKLLHSSMASNALTVIKAANAADILLMQYSMWQLSKQPNSLNPLKQKFADGASAKFWVGGRVVPRCYSCWKSNVASFTSVSHCF